MPDRRLDGQTPTVRRRSAGNIGFLLLALAFVALGEESIATSSVVVDEAAHVPSGVAYWRTGDTALYCENPPLVRALVALPAWLSGAAVDHSPAGLTYRSEWPVATAFRAANGDAYRGLFARSRQVSLLLGLACGGLIFLMARREQGDAPALSVAALWLLDPNVIAHSSIAMTDIGTSCIGFAAVLAFSRYLRQPDWTRALPAGVGLGLALASKFSMLVLIPSYLLLALLARRAAPPAGVRGRVPMVAVLAVAIVILNVVYGCDGSLRPLGRYSFKSSLLSGGDAPSPFSPQGNRFRGTPMAALPVPLPVDYVLGFDSQKVDEELGVARLSGGRVVRGGACYCPLETLVYKLPVGTLLILLGSMVAWVVAGAPFRRNTACLAVPPAMILGLMASQVGLNWLLRYSLPVLPFLFVLAAGPVQAALRHTSWRWALALCLAWNATTLLAARPSFLSYANELAGGPNGAGRLFLGSNHDWGQDLDAIAGWQGARPDRIPMAVSFIGPYEAWTYGLQVRGLPRGFLRPEGTSAVLADGPPGTFYWAVSSAMLRGLPGRIRIEGAPEFIGILSSPLLEPKNAIGRVGQTIFLFRVVDNQLVNGQGQPLGSLERSILDYMAHRDVPWTSG